MARHVIERSYTVDESEVPAVPPAPSVSAATTIRRSSGSTATPRSTATGRRSSFCVCDAPSEAMIREHSDRLGDHTVLAIHETAREVTSDGFPLDDD